MKSLVTFFVKYPAVANIIIAVTLIIGSYSIYSTKKSFFPERESRMIRVQVSYPGSSPEEVEDGITTRVEEAVYKIDGIKEISSNSSENFSSISIEILDDFDIDEVYSDIKNAVDRISSFPVDAERPTIFKVESSSVTQWIGITGDVGLKQLKKIAKRIEDDLLSYKDISQVEVTGIPGVEISIEVSEEDLLRYNLTFTAIASKIRSSNRNFSGGMIKTRNENVMIRAYGKQKDVERLGNIVIVSNPNGKNVWLKDIAIIKEQFEDTPFEMNLDGKQAVFLRIQKLPTEDIEAISKIVNEYSEKFNEANSQVQMIIAFDFYEYLDQRLSLLFSNGAAGLILVILALGFFLSFRLSLWVAWGIPASFLGMFIIGQYFGFTINMISLFGMIMVVGILVDDGIVIAENIYVHFERGKSPFQAAIDGAVEVIPAVTTSVSTTMVAFSPILFIGGAFEFLRDMAFVLIATLAFSLLEAFFVLPAHLASRHILRSKSKQGKIRKFTNGVLDFLQYKLYASVLNFTMKQKAISLAIVTALIPLLIGLVQGGFIKYTFFPNVPFSQLEVEVVYKVGTPQGEVKQTLETIAKKIWQVNEDLKKKYDEDKDFFRHVLTQTGSSNLNRESGTHVGGVSCFYRELDEYGLNQFDLLRLLRKKIGAIPEAEKLNIGGASRWGKPVAVQIMSRDYNEINKAKQDLKDGLGKIVGLKEIQDDTQEGMREIKLSLKPEAYFLGFTHDQISRQVRQGFFGEEVQRLQKGEDEVKVWVRYPEEGRTSLGQMEYMKIKQVGKEYMLNNLVDYKIERGVSEIKHYQTKRNIWVTAELIDPDESAADINKQIEANILPTLRANYPNIKFDFGGQAKESRESGSEMLKGFIIAFFVMFIIIMINFKSFSQAFIIILMIPMAFIGGIFGHGIEGHAVSLLSAWGFLALSGVIINDAVVFLDQYNRFLLQGKSVFQSAYDAGMSRFRPILLTSITTVVGLMPLIKETSFQAQFLIPMAISIAYGVLIGTFIILFFFPTIILVLNEAKVFFKWLFTGKRVAPESIEKVILQKQRAKELAL